MHELTQKDKKDLALLFTKKHIRAIERLADIDNEDAKIQLCKDYVKVMKELTK